MALQLGALRDALLDAGAAPAKADKAAEEAASYESRLSRIQGDLRLLKWMVGTNAAMTVLLLGSQVGLFLKLGEMSGQLNAIARVVLK